MPNNVGTLVIAPVRPQSDADTFAVALANEIRGGHHSVADAAARDAIPSDRLEIGMFCTTQDDGNVYVLRQTTPSLVWELFVGGSAAYGGSIDLNTTDDYYTVTHPAVSGTPIPMVTLVAPGSGADLFIEAVTNVQDESFDVYLSEVPSVTGYKINWTNGPLELINTEAVSDVFSGSIDLTTMSKVYTIDHTPVTGTPLPVASLVAPTSGDAIFGLSIVNVQNDEFTVVLSDTPEVTGYKLHWISAPQ